MNYHITVINKNYFGSRVVIKMKCVRPALDSSWGESSWKSCSILSIHFKGLIGISYFKDTNVWEIKGKELMHDGIFREHISLFYLGT